MRHLAGSFCSLGLGVSAFCHAVIADSKPEVSAPDAVVFRTSAGTGPQHFALALRSAATPASIKRHVILVDTSASQIGKFRDNSLSTLASVLEKLPAGHSVMVAAVDSDFASLTDGFVATGSEQLKSAVSRLSARTPMEPRTFPRLCGIHFLRILLFRCPFSTSATESVLLTS